MPLTFVTSSDTTSAEILPFPNSPEALLATTKAQLANMLVPLRLRLGETGAMLTLAEAAIQIVAEAARAQGKAIPARYALEVEADRAFGIGFASVGDAEGDNGDAA